MARAGILALAACLLASGVAQAQTAEQRKALLEAQADHQAGRSAKAAQALERLLEVEPSLADGQRLLGHVRLAMGRKEQARAAFAAAMACGRGTVDVRANLAILDREAGAHQAALEHARALVALEPESDKWRRLLVEAALEVGALGEARAALRAALELAPEDGQLRLLEGNLALGEGRRRDAALSYELAWALGVRRGTLASSLAELWSAEGDAIAAERWAVEAAALGAPEDARGALRRAQRLMDEGDGMEAARQLEALREGPQAAAALRLLGVLAQRRGDLEGAEARFREALAAGLGGRDAGELWSWLGARSLRREDWEAAAAELERGEALGVVSAVSRRARADALWRLGRWEEAKAALAAQVAAGGWGEEERRLVARWGKARE